MKLQLLSIVLPALIAKVAASPITGDGVTIGGVTVKSQIVGDKLDMELSTTRSNVGWVAIAFGPGHGRNIDSIHCSFGSGGRVWDSYSEGGHDEHLYDEKQNTQLTQSESTNSIKRCRFTRPLSNAADSTDAQLSAGQAMTVSLAFGKGGIELEREDDEIEMEYDEHPRDGYGSGLIVIGGADADPGPDSGSGGFDQSSGLNGEGATVVGVTVKAQVDGNNVIMDLSTTNNNVGWLAIAFGPGHGSGVDSIHCSFGNSVKVFDSYSGGGHSSHRLDVISNTVLTESDSTNALKRCRFTRPLSDAADPQDAALRADKATSVTLGYGSGSIKTNGAGNSMSYSEHPGGGYGSTRVTIYGSGGGGGSVPNPVPAATPSPTVSSTTTPENEGLNSEGATAVGVTVKAEVDGNDVIMDLSTTNNNVGWIAIAFGSGHGNGVDSVHCSFGNSVQVLDSYSGRGRNAHRLDVISNTVLTESDNTNALKRCRFTRPLGNALDAKDAALTADKATRITLGYGRGSIQTNGAGSAMSYSEHPRGGYGSTRMTIYGIGGAEDSTGGVGTGLITHTMLEYAIGGSAGVLFVIIGTYALVKRSRRVYYPEQYLSDGRKHSSLHVIPAESDEDTGPALHRAQSFSL